MLLSRSTKHQFDLFKLPSMLAPKCPSSHGEHWYGEAIEQTEERSNCAAHHDDHPAIEQTLGEVVVVNYAQMWPVAQADT